MCAWIFSNAPCGLRKAKRYSQLDLVEGSLCRRSPVSGWRDSVRILGCVQWSEYAASVLHRLAARASTHIIHVDSARVAAVLSCIMLRASGVPSVQPCCALRACTHQPSELSPSVSPYCTPLRLPVRASVATDARGGLSCSLTRIVET